MPRLRNVALGCVALITAMTVVVRPDQLYVERIEFVGASRAQAAELRHLADVKNGVTVWGVDLEKISQGVQRHPWVSSVRAERRLPGTVVVRVEEHVPVALLAWGSELYYVDASGRPFLRAHTHDLDYPVLTGVGPQLELTHPELPRLVLHDALWLMGELDARGILTRDRISEIGFSKTRGFTIQTTGAVPGRPSARVLVGFGGYERQLRHLSALQQQGVDLSEPLQVDVAPETVAIVRPVDRDPTVATP